ncbi:MAG: tetratricopeptide repeat protein [Bacteroidota bacterium]
MVPEKKNRNILVFSIVFSVLVVASKVIAGIWESPLAWGINFGSYLPSPYFIIYGFGSLLIIAAIKIITIDGFILRGVDWMEKKPYLLVGIFIAVFIGLAFIFRVQAPLLGDSFVLMNNYSNTFKEGHDLYIVREPLAIIYFYLIMGAMGTYAYPALTWAFFYGELFLGTIFILLVYGIVKEIALQPKERFLLSLFLLLLPSTELFFGYVEVYSVVLFSLSVFIYAALRYMNGKLPFMPVVLSYYLLVCTHMVAIIIFPAIIYLGWLEYQKRGWKYIFIGTGVGIAGLAALIFGANETFRRILPESDQPHYLSLFPINDDYHAYTLLSPYHFSEIGNLLLLVCPFAIFFTVVGLFGKKNILIDTPQKKFFLLSAVGVLAFIFIAKFELAMSKDWDVSTPWLFLFQCYGAIVFLQSEYGDKMKAFVLILLVSIFHSFLWFTLNSSVEPNINRVASLRDGRVFSREANFLTTLHLARYKYLNGDFPGSMAYWEQFVGKFPNYVKGYTQLISGYNEKMPDSPEKVEQAIQKLLELDPGNETVKKSYLSICMFEANKALREKQPERAEQYYRKVLGLDSLNLNAYNNLGDIYAASGDLEKALDYYEKTILINPKFVYGYANLGKIYLHLGDYYKAASYLNQTILLDSTSTDAYQNLASVYTHIGKSAKAHEMLKIGKDMAARSKRGER